MNRNAKAFGIRGTRMGDEGVEENRRYIRVLPSLDVSQPASRERVIGLVDENVLKNLAVRVVVDRQPKEDTAVADFIETLKDRPSLHFIPCQ